MPRPMPAAEKADFRPEAPISFFSIFPIFLSSRRKRSRKFKTEDEDRARAKRQGQ